MGIVDALVPPFLRRQRAPIEAQSSDGRFADMGEGGQVRIDYKRADTAAGRISEAGDRQQYLTYDVQVNELYRMLEGLADFGGELTKAVLDYRTSFLAGEGLRLTGEGAGWAEDFLAANQYNGQRLIDAVMDAEVTGHILLSLEATVPYPTISRWPVDGSESWKPVYQGDRVVAIEQERDGRQEMLFTAGDPFVYVRTGGHGNVWRFPQPTTRLCLAVSSLKSYDRALAQIRDVNDHGARITPAWTAANRQALNELFQHVKESKWSIGDHAITDGEFKYEVPGTGAVDTLTRELAAVVKDIAGLTGIPVHWLGYTDLMSNRATADSLFETIRAATLRERLALEEGFAEVCRRAAVMAGRSPDIIVNMPLLSFRDFQSRSDTLLALQERGIIGVEDIRAQLPFEVDAAQEARPMTEEA